MNYCWGGLHEIMIVKYEPKIHHRRSIRLKEYDYSKEGEYFVTICVYGRKCLFGRIKNLAEKNPGIHIQMQLNDAGEMVQKWWLELPNKFSNIILDEYVVMPNHLHGIIKIVGANLCVRPVNEGQTRRGQTHMSAPTYPKTVGKMIQWFKIMTTNEYIRGVKFGKFQPFEKFVWQRNYWEHIIRNEYELCGIREYIINNPCTFEKDKLFINS